MLTINNLKNISGSEFQLGNGTKYMIGMTDDQPNHYTFVVFELDERNVANLISAIYFQLHKMLYNDGADYYALSSDRLKYNRKVRKQNTTLKNFVLELHMATGLIINKR